MSTVFLFVSKHDYLECSSTATAGRFVSGPKRTPGFFSYDKSNWLFRSIQVIRFFPNSAKKNLPDAQKDNAENIKTVIATTKFIMGLLFSSVNIPAIDKNIVPSVTIINNLKSFLMTLNISSLLFQVTRILFTAFLLVELVCGLLEAVSNQFSNSDKTAKRSLYAFSPNTLNIIAVFESIRPITDWCNLSILYTTIIPTSATRATSVWETVLRSQYRASRLVITVPFCKG